MEWMLDIHLGRRNLSPIQRIAVAEKYRPIYEKQALINKQNAINEARKNNKNNKNEQFLVNLPKTVPINTSEKLASVAGVSEKTYRMGAKILNSDNEEVKEKVLSGEIGNGNRKSRYQNGTLNFDEIAQQLGIKTVMCDVHTYNNDDEVLADLIETNIRQRGIGNTNQRKMGLCIKELDRIYGIREGSAGKVSSNLETNNFTPKNEEELLKSLGLGVTRQTIQNYKKLTEMIPELEELVDTGILL